MIKIFCFVILLMVLITFPAFATTFNASSPVYVTSTNPNTTVEQSEILWGVSGTHDATITTAAVKTQIQPGDQVSVDWTDNSGNTIGTSSVDSSISNLNPPSGAYGARIVLTTGSASGSRWAWWSSVSNSIGNTTIFPDPDTGGSTGGSTTVNVDLTPVVNELQTIQGQLTTIQDKMDTIISNSSSGGTGGSLDEVVSAINDQTDQISTKFDEVKGKLDTLDSHVVDIRDYLKTPRTSQPFTVNLPNMTVDPTPPPITEPPQQPYKYDRPTPQMPPFVDSPGPLPLAPDPVAMKHDPAATIEQPKQTDQPRALDPVRMDTPRQLDPVTREQPRTTDSVRMDNPRQLDPVTKEQPRTTDSVRMDNPRARENPLGIDAPKTRDNPITPDPPLTPDPPR